MVLDKMARTKWYGQNGTDKMVATFIDSNSTELNFYSIITGTPSPYRIEKKGQ